MVSAMKSTRYDLGPTPRPPVVRFTYTDGSVSAPYFLDRSVLEVPDGVASVEIRHLPVYPHDYPAANEPGWGHKDGSGAQDLRPGEEAVTRVEVRGREHFQNRPAG